MRIALLTPTFWPEVRRGSERLVHDLAESLADRGHEPTVLTSHRGAPAQSVEDGAAVSRAWRPPERAPLDWYEHHVANIPSAFARTLRGGFDVAHAFFSADAWAALRARAVGGPPVVFSIHGILNRTYLVRRRYRVELTETAVRDADVVSVLSQAAAEPARAYFAREPVILPGGVRVADFQVSAERAGEPTIVCAASLGDPRKRASLLFEAFARVRSRLPDARLLLVRTADPVMSGAVGDLPDGAEWVAGDRTDELAALYASAWVSVLPAVAEAFGLVLVESLATGTPVVAARSGACPEIMTSGEAGWLFEPDDPDALAESLLAALAAPPDPARVTACREVAAAWDWARVVESYERVYESLV